MKDKALYDISEVCNIFKTTSRTLRFYEEKGIIQSSYISNSNRRQYTKDQINHISNVLVLRTLGLSIKSIYELQQNNTDLKNLILSKRAEIYASIDKRNNEICLLNEALSIIESGKDIFKTDLQQEILASAEEKQIVEICSNAIVYANTEELYKYLSPKMIEYSPKPVYELVRKDTLLPLGDFISFEKTVVDSKCPNRIYKYAKYSKLGLKITYVFHNHKIDGLWLDYYEIKQR